LRYGRKKKKPRVEKYSPPVVTLVPLEARTIVLRYSGVVKGDKKGMGGEGCGKPGKWKGNGRAKEDEGYTMKADLMAP